ncbi:MAG: hypothetical protein IJY20_07285 [Clostridia bacterium]|nr:hypothetical protein [Clostridia bacterium]
MTKPRQKYKAQRPPLSALDKTIYLLFGALGAIGGLALYLFLGRYVAVNCQ